MKRKNDEIEVIASNCDHVKDKAVHNLYDFLRRMEQFIYEIKVGKKLSEE